MLGIRNRRSDYDAAERSFEERGRAFDRLLDFLLHAFQGEAVVDGDLAGERRRLSPLPIDIPILIGGHGRRAIARTVEYAAGWASGAQDAATVEKLAGRIRDAWTAAGRRGTPRLVGMAYYCTRPADSDTARQYLLDYYASYGDRARQIADRLLTTPQQCRETLRRFAGIGINEFVFSPTLADAGEIHRLADGVLYGFSLAAPDSRRR